jgi:hypothetical protein
MQKGQDHQIKLRMKTNDEGIWFWNKELFAHISHSNNRGLESGEMSVFCAKGLCACWPRGHISNLGMGRGNSPDSHQVARARRSTYCARSLARVCKSARARLHP